MSLTDIEREALQGALDGPARNHCATRGEGIALWDGLVAKGYAALLGRPAEGYDFSFYKVTPEGYAALKAATEVKGD